MCAVSLVFRVVHRFHLFGHALRIVGNHQFHRVHHCRNSQRPFVQVVAHGSFQQSHVVQGIEFGVADALDEVSDAFGRVTPAAHTTERGHTRVIPSAHIFAIHQRVQLSLAHHGISQVQTVELNLARTEVVQVVAFAFGDFQVVDKRIIERTVRHKLQCTDGVGHALKVVALSVGKVIHGVSVPLSACAVVRCVNDAIHDGVAEVHVGVGHIQLCPQHH